MGGKAQVLELLRSRLVGLFASGADPADQSLGDDALEGAGDQIGLDADVQEPLDGAGSIVGVDGRQDDVAGDGGPHGDLGGLAVADLTDGDDVGVLAQDGAQAAGKGHACLFIDLDLVDTVHIVFDGILQSHQVDLAGIELIDDGVHGGGLTGAGGTHDQKDAVFHPDQAPVLFQVVARKADGVRTDEAAGLVQQTQNDLLSIYSRQGRDTQVDLLVADADIEAAVLGNPSLRDVHAAHDLDAGQDRGLQLSGNRESFAQDTVDAHADLEFGLPWLDMDITGALIDGALDDGVDQADGRGTVGGVLSDPVGGKGGFDGLRGVPLGGRLPAHLLDGPRRALISVEDSDRAFHGGSGGDHRRDLAVDCLAHLLYGNEIEGIHHGQEKFIADQAHRHDLVLLCDIFGQDLGQLRRNRGPGQVHELDAELHLQGFDQVILSDETMLLQDGPQSLVGSLLQSQALLKVRLCDHTGRDQEVSQTEVPPGSGRLFRSVK